MSFFLKLDGELLATLKPFGLDFTWWNCEIVTTDKFSVIEPLIERVSNTEDMEIVNEIWEQIDEMGVTIEDEAGLKRDPFVLYLKGDGTARLRCSP